MGLLSLNLGGRARASIQALGHSYLQVPHTEALGRDPSFC